MLCYAMHEKANTHTLIECVCVCVRVCVPAEKTHDVKYEIWNHMHVFLYKTCPKGTTSQSQVKPKPKQKQKHRGREEKTSAKAASINDWTKQRVKWKPPQRSWKYPNNKKRKRDRDSLPGRQEAMHSVPSGLVLWLWLRLRNACGLKIKSGSLCSQDVPHGCCTAATTANCCLRGVGATNKHSAIVAVSIPASV